MTKTELIKEIAEKTELSKKDVELALNGFTNEIKIQLKKGEKVQIVGFGTFETSIRAAREGRNPSTGDIIQIGEMKVPKFKAGSDLKAAVK